MENHLNSRRFLLRESGSDSSSSQYILSSMRDYPKYCVNLYYGAPIHLKLLNSRCISSSSSSAAGLHAQTMAERGFLTIAFDPSFTGESGGTPRYMASPDINTEDFQAAVDFLSVQDNVDHEKIGFFQWPHLYRYAGGQSLGESLCRTAGGWPADCLCP